MDLNISNYARVQLFGLEFFITETMVNTWLIMGILITLAIIGRIAIARAEMIPGGLQNIYEIAIEKFDSFVVSTVGSKLSFVGPWFFAVFAFLVASALISIFGFRAPTADWSMTIALSLCTFILMVFTALRFQGPVDYFKSLLVPAWVFLPVNIIGEMAKPISLSFRLFGNMLSGTIIITMYNALTPWWASIGVPIGLHLIFDIFFGLLQAYIFVVISMSYIHGAGEA